MFFFFIFIVQGVYFNINIKNSGVCVCVFSVFNSEVFIYNCGVIYVLKGVKAK